MSLTLKVLIIRKYNGFTLIEILVVIAIIVTLIGIILPLFASVRKDGYKTVAISNLKQCGTSLLIYSQDYDGLSSMPDYDTAVSQLSKMPSCDLADTWRNGCSAVWGKPLIGSFAYVRGVSRYEDQNQWQGYLELTSNTFHREPTLLMSIFYADNVPIPLHGDKLDLSLLPQCGNEFEKCKYPNKILRFRGDGSVSLTTWKSWNNIKDGLFDWEGLFFYAE